MPLNDEHHPAYEVLEDFNGKTFVLYGEWQEAYRERFIQEKLTSLRVRGRVSGLGFVKDLANLETLFIDHPGKNAKPIEELSELRSLTLLGAISSRLDLHGLVSLETLGLPWSGRVTGMGSLKQLQKVSIENADEAALVELSGLPRLESLRLFRTQSSHLEPLGTMGRLRSLWITSARRLLSILFLSQLTELEDLYVQDCSGFHDLSVLSGLKNLQKVGLEDVGEIQSLFPLALLPRIRKVAVFGGKGTSVEDKDFSLLLANPSLEALDIVGRGGCAWRRSPTSDSGDGRYF